MSRTEYSTVKLWEVKRTANAILFQTDLARLSASAPVVWLPLSEIKSIVKEAPVAGFLPECVVEIPDWLIEARQL